MKMNKVRQNSRNNDDSEYKPVYRKSHYRRNRIIFTIFLCIIFIVITLGNMLFQRKLAEIDAVPGEVVRVVDGDTILIRIEGKEARVRLIGVDCPESVSENDEENTIYGEIAGEFTKSMLIPGMPVFITYDVEKEDRYGRVLAYVWTGDNIGDLDNLFQKQLLEGGYAVADPYEPNTMYATELQLAMNIAREEKAGLWSDEIFYEDYKEFLY